MKLAPLVFALILASCTDGDSPTGGGSFTDVIVPLKVGNSWQYNATQYDSTGAGWAWQNFALEILQDTLLDNEKCYFLGEGQTLVVNRNDGLWGFDLGKIPQYLVLKYPASKGYTYSTGSQREYTVTVRTRDTTIAVPPGTYSCYLYVARHLSGGEFHALVAPNTGIVKAEVFAPRQFGGTYLALQVVLFAFHLEE